MNTNAYPEPALWRENPLPRGLKWLSSAHADAALQFGRFRVLLRSRQLLADGAPVELGADRDVIRTEFGRGYRFTGVLCTNTVTDARQRPTRPKQRSGRTLFPQNC